MGKRSSSCVAGTRSRTEKVQQLADCLRALGSDERVAGVAFLSGELPQGVQAAGPVH